MGFLRTLIGLISKKKNLLDTNTIQNTALQVAMFMNWFLENGPDQISWEEAEMVAQKILTRDTKSFNENDLLLINGTAHSLEYGLINESRKKTKFDQSVNEFCQSIKLDDKYYKFEVTTDKKPARKRPS